MASTEDDLDDHEVDTSEIPAIRPSPRPRPADGATTADEAVVDSELADDDPDADLFDDESWNRPKRTNRLTALLLVGLLVICGFIAGVAVQKNHDAGLFPGAGATAGRNRAGGTGGPPPPVGQAAVERAAVGRAGPAPAPTGRAVPARPARHRGRSGPVISRRRSSPAPSVRSQATRSRSPAAPP